MRITQITVMNDMLANLNLSFEQMDNLGNQLASGKKIRVPSDDPANAAYSLDLQSALDVNTSYQNSGQSGKGWLESTAASLNQLVQITTRARTLTVQATNDTNSPTDRQAIASEVNQLIQQTLIVGNQTYAGNSIFAGTAVTSTPFNTIGGYSGNSGQIVHQISPTYSLRLNTNPMPIFSGKGGLYNVLSQIAIHLNATGNPIAPLNTGTEQMALSGNVAAGAATTNFLVKVSSISASVPAQITGVNYSTDGGVTWQAGTATATPQQFQLGTGGAATGMTATFTGGAVDPVVGDQFAFTSGTAGTLSSTYAITGGPNVGNEVANLTGTYGGTGTPQFTFRPVTLDTNNNVVGIQMSTDNGATWSPTINANEYTSTALTYPTPVTFTLGNGLTLNYTQSSVNAGRVVANGDTLSFTQTSSLLSSDLTGLDKVISTISGAQATNGAAQNAIDNTTQQLQSQSISTNKMLSLISDVDFASVTTQYTTAQDLYKAALGVDARSIQPSLLDYLH